MLPITRIALYGSLVCWFGMCVPASSNELTDKQIIDRLSIIRSRSLAPAPQPTYEELQVLTVLKSRGLKYVSQASKKVDIAYDIVNKYNYPKLSFSIEFAFGSAQIDKKSEQQLLNLSTALRSEKFTNAEFVLVGHTDAKGSDDFNRRLSYRRAISVMTYLINRTKISPNMLSAVGLGESRLKKPEAPFADENRRVEIIKLSAN